jgi:nitroimidazol reductase NimA-like FMN-containing flavoprotein (pyridoxamine 5'-phosphate oxidase superfamily)
MGGEPEVEAMSIGKLRDEESLAILRDGNLGRLGCIADGKPYVVPVHYFFDGKDVYIHSLPGRKINALRANSRACLQVDEIRDAYHWRSVIAYGNYEEILEKQARESILSKLFTRLPHLTPVESRLADGLKQTIVFRIRVDEVTGVGEEW